ncbi:hypothetical protein [Taibaiella sp. KBW10]|uniref:hypothetical protein n=1 Tax=Taibaiella sp. KBW10 TaxID=2153357 RepID=UPI001F450085|nr:hypothetical protein [Taibaiella sp. KBW10]
MLCLSSCVILDTPGFHSGYKKLNASDKQQIHFVTETKDFCNIQNDKKIYAVTADLFLDCIKDKDITLVYFWSAHCGSEVCILLSAAQAYCDQRNYNLYVVSEYYDLPATLLQNKTRNPILSVNHLYYKTDYCPKYTRRFRKAIAGAAAISKDELRFSRFYFFKGSKFIKAKQKLTD